jgi:methylated-DNA-protein-cysteine methyltransferase-like protein
MKQKKKSPFDQVWALVRRIPATKVATFGQIAKLLDFRLSPLVSWAIHAARTAKEKNDVPWQRVVGADGRVSLNDAYGRKQRTLLARDGVRVAKDGAVDLTRHAWAGPHSLAGKIK